VLCSDTGGETETAISGLCADKAKAVKRVKAEGGDKKAAPKRKAAAEDSDSKPKRKRAESQSQGNGDEVRCRQDYVVFMGLG
jgi:hypothetical protein